MECNLRKMKASRSGRLCCVRASAYETLNVTILLFLSHFCAVVEWIYLGRIDKNNQFEIL